MPWSCFRPKPQVLTSAEPKVAVEPVVSEPVVVVKSEKLPCAPVVLFHRQLQARVFLT